MTSPSASDRLHRLLFAPVDIGCLVFVRTLLTLQHSLATGMMSGSLDCRLTMVYLVSGTAAARE